jgi:hypothetical protein
MSALNTMRGSLQQMTTECDKLKSRITGFNSRQKKTERRADGAESRESYDERDGLQDLLDAV